uniref:MSC domain-containing protein n=1 Tax=Steinernema glaseri TaxID=37863 RepID=A0A1I7Z329_9BILA
MDRVPSAFVRSLVETLVPSDKFWNPGPVKELGRGYGRIVREVCDAATICTIETPGVFFATPFNKNRVFMEAPTFSGVFNGSERKPPVPAKNLLQLNVRSQSLFFEEDDALLEGTSIREIQRLMEQCRHARVRRLVIERPSSTVVPRSSIALIPDLITFFNTVYLSYDDTDSYREFLLAFVEAKRLERLDIYISSEDGFPNATPPHWFQETILKAFFQPQLQELEVYFKHSTRIPSVLFDILIREWLWKPETFPECYKFLSIGKSAPPISLLRGYRSVGYRSVGYRFVGYRFVGYRFVVPGLRSYGFSSVAEAPDDDTFPKRRFLLLHPKYIERMLEVTVDIEKEFSDEEFTEKASSSDIHFHFNIGQNAMYWRTQRTKFITKKPWVSAIGPFLGVAVLLALAAALLLYYWPSFPTFEAPPPLSAENCYDAEYECKADYVQTDTLVVPYAGMLHQIANRCCKEESEWTRDECHLEFGNFLFHVIPCSNGHVWNRKWFNGLQIWCCPIKV